MGKSNVFSTFEDNSAKTTKHVQEGFEDLTDPYFIENVPTGLMKENVLLQICVWCDGSGGPSTCDEFVSLNRVFVAPNIMCLTSLLHDSASPSRDPLETL